MKLKPPKYTHTSPRSTERPGRSSPPRLSGKCLSSCFPLLTCDFHPQGHFLVPGSCWEPQPSQSSFQMRRKERMKSSNALAPSPSSGALPKSHRARLWTSHWPHIDTMATLSCTVCREVFSFGLDVLPRVLILRKKGVSLAVSL